MVERSQTKALEIANPSMPTIKELLDTLPQQGKLEWIATRPARGQEMHSHTACELSTELGLVGDRYKGRSRERQITLVQAEHLPVVASCTGRAKVAPELLRRNLLVSGINLLALKDKTFYVGSVELLGTGLCHPCSRMETLLGDGGYNAMRGHGGITARVLSNGKIALGDAVTRFAQSGAPTGYQAIACADYDHLELACMESYELEVVLKDGRLGESTLRGTAVTTRTNSNGEYLQLRVGDGSIKEIRADGILKLVVLSKNARFDERTFGAGD